MNEKQKTSLLTDINSNLRTANYMYGASTLSSMMGAGVNYNLMKVQNANLGIQANQIELNAIEQVNSMREQFNQAISQVQFNAVQRGIKSTSGSVQQNIEMSAKNFGNDAKTINNNAKMQANALRGQQAVNNKIAKANMFNQMGSSLLNFSSGLYANQQTSKTANSLLGSKK